MARQDYWNSFWIRELQEWSEGPAMLYNSLSGDSSQSPHLAHPKLTHCFNVSCFMEFKEDIHICHIPLDLKNEAKSNGKPRPAALFNPENKSTIKSWHRKGSHLGDSKMCIISHAQFHLILAECIQIKGKVHFKRHL